jgi:glutaredoxin 3
MTDTPRIKMFGTAGCPYCLAARMLLKKKSLAFEDVAVDGDYELRKEMENLSGRWTVPQIFIDEKPIGGFEELYALDSSGELDRLLGIDTGP